MKTFVWLLVILCLLPGVLAVDINLGNLNVRNPKILVEFTESSQLKLYKLTTIDSVKSYPLCVKPTNTAATYETNYELYTTTATDADCMSGTWQYLTPGDYLFTLQAVDTSGKLTPVYNVPFHISGLEIHVLTPESNVSPYRPPRINFITTKLSPAVLGEQGTPELTDAICKYTTTLVKSWDQTTFADLHTDVGDGTPASSHDIAIDYQGELFIICKENFSAGQEAKYRMNISYDLSAPKITNVVRNPAIVTTLTGLKGLSHIQLKTDDLAACNITGQGTSSYFNDESRLQYASYVTTHDIDLLYDPLIVGTAEKNFTYNATCANLAGRTNSTTFNVTVNFANALSLQVLNPPSIINQTSFELLVRPVRLANPYASADECYVNDDGAKRAANAMTKRTIADGAGGTMTVFGSLFTFDASGSQDGRKEFNITCYAGNVTSILHYVTLDSRAPSAPVMNTSAFICSGNLSAAFASTDVGTGVAFYNYSLTDGAGTLASGTSIASAVSVHLPRITQGTVTWQAYAVDAAQNKGAVNTTQLANLTDGSDEECGLPPFIRIVQPGMGFATDLPYNLEIATARPSVCRYSFLQSSTWQQMTPFSSTDHLLHVKTDLNYRDPKTFYVACNESALSKLHTTQFSVGLDPSAANIAVQGIPNPVIDQSAKVVTLTITTDDRTYCTLDGKSITPGSDGDQASYTTTHTTQIDYRSITDLARQEFSYEISCKNLALTESIVDYNIIVHLGADFTIDVLSPPSFTANDDITLRIKPSKEAVCTWDKNGTTMNFTVTNGTHVAHVGTLAAGSHSIPVFCTASADEASAVVEFTIDKSAPDVTAITGSSVLCPGDDATYTIKASSSDTDLIYQYDIQGANASFNTSDDVIILPTLQSGNYTLVVQATNRANVTGKSAIKDIVIAEASDAICQLPTDHCANGKLDPSEEAIDCGGSCTACIACRNDSECGPGEWCNSGYCEATTLECTADSQCASTEICDAGKCVARDTPPDECTTNSDCPSGKECVQSVCVERTGCDTNNDCAYDEICDDGTCKVAQQSAGCTSDASCSEGQVCSAGACVAVPAKESHLLSILLIVLGVAIMGGAGYFLYQQNTEKAAQRAAQRAAEQRTPVRSAARSTTLSPQMAQHYEENREARQAALAQEYARRQAERTQRNATFESFGTAPAGAVPTSTPLKAEVKPEMTKEKTDEYVDLTALKKNSETKKSTEKKGEDDAFDKLGKL